MFSYSELDEIFRFLSTLQTCDYLGERPTLDEEMNARLNNIIGAVRVELAYC